MKAAYLELPVRKPLPEEFVANPQTHHIMCKEAFSIQDTSDIKHRVKVRLDCPQKP